MGTTRLEREREVGEVGVGHPYPLLPGFGEKSRDEAGWCRGETCGLMLLKLFSLIDANTQGALLISQGPDE